MAPRTGPHMSAARTTILALSLLGAGALPACDQGNGAHAAQAQPKPGEKKPSESRPADAKPETFPLTISGRTFKLELALTDVVRMKGLGQRDKIAEDGGMLFGFPDAETRAFVMRDCPVDIDIIYLDGAGRILSFYEMKAEAPRGPGEGKVGDVNAGYEARLKKYSSRFPTQFVVELKGGTIPSLGLKTGEAIKADWESLKKRAK